MHCVQKSGKGIRGLLMTEEERIEAFVADNTECPFCHEHDGLSVYAYPTGYSIACAFCAVLTPRAESFAKALEYWNALIKVKNGRRCTGVEDSDGELIYENDIVQVVSGKWHSDSYNVLYFTVCFHEPSRTFELHGKADDVSLKTLITWIKKGKKCFVVGQEDDY